MDEFVVMIREGVAPYLIPGRPEWDEGEAWLARMACHLLDNNEDIDLANYNPTPELLEAATISTAKCGVAQTTHHWRKPQGEGNALVFRQFQSKVLQESAMVRNDPQNALLDQAEGKLPSEDSTWAKFDYLKLRETLEVIVYGRDDAGVASRFVSNEVTTRDHASISDFKRSARKR